MNRVKVISLVLFFCGIGFLLESFGSFDAYVVLEYFPKEDIRIFGITLTLIGGLIFLKESVKNGLENKVVSSKVKSDTHLLKIAKSVGRREDITRDINHLIHELNRGNTNPGIGTQHISEGIYELRGRNGGRVFYREIEGDKFEILAYSDKEKQAKVIDYLRNKYGHGYT